MSNTEEVPFWHLDTGYLFARSAHARGEYTIPRILDMNRLAGANEAEMLDGLTRFVAEMEQLPQAGTDSGGEFPAQQDLEI